MKKFIYMISVLVFMCVFSISSFAMIPYGSINDLQYFEDGPWSGLPYKYVGVGSDNTVSGLYSLTGWREGSGLGSAYYNIGAYGKTRDFYMFSGSGWHNFTVCSEDPLMELYIINLDGSVLCNVLEDAFLCEFDGKYFYGVSLFGGVGVGMRTGSQEYDEAEQNVLDQVNDSLNDFEFDGGFEEYANTIKVFSDFLQALYESSGGFKVVINLSLMLSIAGIVIGVYRFKEGG